SAILWHDAHGQSHCILDSEPGVPGYYYGNGLRLSTALDQHGRADLLSLSRHGKPFWLQRNWYDPQGRLSHEAHIVGDHREPWRYAYDDQSRLIGAQQESRVPAANGLQGPTQHEPVWYAWHDNGSMAARREGLHTHKPAIHRDASGLPQRIADYTLEYGPARR